MALLTTEMTMSSKWHESSFLLELKPHAEYANLFVSCLDGGSRHMVKVLCDRIEIGTALDCNRDTRDDGTKISSGEIPGVRMNPDTVSNLTWADGETLFTCRLKADIPDRCLDTKSFLQLSTEIFGDLKLDDYCKLLKKFGSVTSFCCSYCCEEILSDDAKISEFYALPCDDWQELSGKLDFFCGESSCCKSTADRRASGSADKSLERKPNVFEEFLACSRCMISESYFLLNEIVTSGRICTREDGSLQCNHCLSELGLVISEFSQGDCVIHKFFHTTTKLLANRKTDSAFLVRRFGSLEQYYAWWLLVQSQSQSSLKFIIRALNRTPKLIIWLLDSYSVMVKGTLTSSVQSHGLKTENCQPFAAVKLLYKVFDDHSAAADPKTYGQDFSIAYLEQPLGSCLALTQLLLDSTQSLPPVCRTVGQFYVGYLKLAKEWK